MINEKKLDGSEYLKNLPDVKASLEDDEDEDYDDAL